MSEKIVVLLSSYNGEKYISKQIESILNQLIDCDLTLIIRDDGSTDSTKKIINEYLIKNDNVIFYEGSNVGYIKSFFSLIMNSGDFDFYALSDQDDIWQSNKLQNAVNQIRKKRQKNDIILFGSTSNLVYDDMKPFGVTQKNLRGLIFIIVLFKILFLDIHK